MSELNENMDPTLDIIRYISGEMSNDERLRFQAWLEESPDNKASYTSMLEVWDQADRAANIMDIDPKAEWNKLDAKLFGQSEAKVVSIDQAPKKKFNWKSLAAVLIIAVATTVYFGLQQGGTTVQTMAQIKASDLPDGSVVDLAKHSSIEYESDFGQTKRKIKLKGKALFEVAHDAQKPFIVDAGPVEVTVLGTNFLVEAENVQDSVAVIVNRGKVSVKDKSSGQEVILTAGERAVFLQQSRELKEMVNTEENHLSWKTRIFNFKGTKIKRVVKRLNEAHDVQIVVQDPAIADCRLTTTLKADQSVDEVVTLITTIYEGVSASKADGQILLSGSCTE